MIDSTRPAARGGELPEVSVVVPVYNREDSIRECVDSLLAMDYPADMVEIIVVDNGSTDATRRLLAGYGSSIRAENEPLRGAGPARNRGVEAASGEVIAFTDSDCTVDRRWLRQLVPPLAKQGVGIVGGRIRSRRPCTNVERFGEYIHDHQKAIEVFKPPYVITMNWACRRETLREVGPFDSRLTRGQDVDLSFRFLQAGYELHYQSDALIYHQNEGSFGGLFGEGLQHGFWAVLNLKIHREYVAQFGHRRLDWRGYSRLFRSLREALNGSGNQVPLCDFVFNSGKKLGKLAGSARFLYLDL